MSENQIFRSSQKKVLRRRLNRHGEWMLRVVAVALGIGLSRVYLSALVHFGGLAASEAMGIVFWLGSGSNLLITEIWLRARRRAKLGAVA